MHGHVFAAHPPQMITSWLWDAGKGAATWPERGKVGFASLVVLISCTQEIGIAPPMRSAK